jgi:hypothetical protein
LLGNEKVENYDEDFIKYLFEKYSSQQVIDNMASNNSKFFFKFAKHWPCTYFLNFLTFSIDFLRNNALLHHLISIKGGSTLVKQQSEII